MVQVRKTNGKFGGKAPDIKKSDVDNAIRLVMDETYNEVRVSFKKPLMVVSQAEVRHSFAIAEFCLFALLVVTVSAYLWMRVVP